MKKKLIIAGFITVALSLIFISGTKGKTGSSYNGDALYFRGKIYLSAINSGVAELYKIENTKISKVATVKANAGKFGCQGFIDALLNIESRGLFLFLTDGEYVYKYDINDELNPVLYKKSNDDTNSKFIGLGKMDNKVYSVSDQGLKIWDDDMRVFYNARLNNSLPRNIKFSKQGSFIFNINRDRLEIYDAFSQKLISSIDLEVNDNHERNIYNDETDGSIYLSDDQQVKQVDFSGNIIKSFKHNSEQGYDIAYTPGDDHLYFSDGLGIVKLNKMDLKPLSWVYTKDFSGPNGWATGLKVVRDNYGEKIFVFDGFNIIVLDQDYKKIGTILTNNGSPICSTPESLFLALSKNSAVGGSEVIVSGRGFSQDEELSIYLANKKIDSARADNNGRFLKTVTIPRFNPNKPDFKSGPTDIKVLGEISSKTYSINFKIEKGIEEGVEEGFSLSADNNSGLPGEKIVLSGRGFNPNEYVIIYIADQKVALAKTDQNGAFSATIVIPEVKPSKTEIRVTGENYGSKQYMIVFTIK